MSKNEVIRQIDPYEIAFNAERKRYEELSQEAGNLRTENERINKAYSELESQNTVAATDRNAQKSKVQTLENEVKRLEQENTKLKGEYDALQKGYQYAQKMFEDEKKKYNAKPTQGNEALMKENKRLKDENQRLVELVNDAYQYIKADTERERENGRK